MFTIRKYADAWAIINDDTGESRKLTEQEIIAVQEEFPTLKDEQVRSVFADEIRSIGKKHTPVRQVKRKNRRKH